ncbi:MAG: leucine-rich repeat protein, partial [Flavobacterium sp.]
MATSNKALELIKLCNDNRNTELDLSDCQLQEIPQEINDFYWLKTLYLNNNKIEKISNLEKLVNLEELKINSNKISKIQGLEALSRLTFLDLYENQIEVIENLESLSELKFLGFPNNNISKIQGLSHLKKLSKLWLDSNQIQSIEGLDTLENLTVLGLRNNRIANISGLKNLIKLDILSLAENVIHRIENLENLTQLHTLYLWGNPIKRIQGLDALINISILYLSSNQIEKIEGLDKLVNVKELYLHNNQIVEIEGLNKLKRLSILSLGSNHIEVIKGLEKIQNVTSLNLAGNLISRIENIYYLKKLITLNLNANKINNIEGLKGLNKLSTLALGSNNISKIDGLDGLDNLKELYLQENMVSKIENINHLKSLSVLVINRNFVLKIEGIESLKKLSALHLMDNKINEEYLLNTNINFIKRLKILTLEGNPIKSLPAESLNNVMAIIGYLKSKQERQVPNKFLKVNIIGEGRIGKTQLFRFLNKQKYLSKSDETHGTNTMVYKIPKKEYSIQIWDFGGQSYHHGFHKVFIRPKDFNLVLWCSKDTQDPNYPYWLGTARNYSPDSPILLVQNVWEITNFTDEKTIFKPHSIIYPDSQKLQTYKIGLDSVFAINVKALQQKVEHWKIQNDYFLNSFHQKIIQYSEQIETFKEVSERWIKIKEALDLKPIDDLYLTKDDFKKKYAKNFDNTRFETLLFYLEFTGNILYFSNNRELNEYIFPNPPQLSHWIYNEILNKRFKNNNNGVLDFEQLILSIGEEKAFLFREIVESFNLLFEEKDNENHLVIPQFLPEQNHVFKDYLLELIPMSFCIRFEDFINEGKIFQFISEYGQYANEKTSYWRYGILFSKNDIKALVYYENTNRTISVHIENKKGRLDIAQEIFDFFVIKQEITNYRGKRLSLIAKKIGVSISKIVEVLKKRKYEIPLDPNYRIPLELESELYNEFTNTSNINKQVNQEDNSFFKTFAKNQSISESELFNSLNEATLKRKKISSEHIVEGSQLSTNNKSNFIDIKSTINQNKDGMNIGFCIINNQIIKLDYLAINLLGMENHKLPKVFISYNRKDLEFKDELRSHLSILERYDLLKAWTCDEIKAGKWDKQIQTELEEADIIVYMISHNFMSSDYIMEKEVKKGIQLIEQNPNKKIICVLVGECMWNSWAFLEEKFKEIKGGRDTFSESMDLSSFQFLPYHQYKNNLGVAVKEEIVALEQWGRNHYEVRNVAFKQIVSK